MVTLGIICFLFYFCGTFNFNYVTPRVFTWLKILSRRVSLSTIAQSESSTNGRKVNFTPLFFLFDSTAGTLHGLP